MRVYGIFSSDHGGDDDDDPVYITMTKTTSPQEVFGEMFEGLSLSAASGNICAMLMEGKMMKEQSPEDAARLFADAANRGDAEGQYEYALCLNDGVGCKKDPVAATQLLAMASASQPKKNELRSQKKNKSKQNVSAKASLLLGYKYQTGDGVERNLDKAEELYNRVGWSETGDDPTAMLNLGNLLATPGYLKRRRCAQLRIRRDVRNTDYTMWRLMWEDA
jgi:TPR repeat protein